MVTGAFKAMILGSGRGYWFGYGRHWGRPGTQNAISLAADPYVPDKRIERLLTPRERRLPVLGAWRGPWTTAPLLSAGERAAVIQALFEGARLYRGFPRRRMLERLRNLSSEIDGYLVDDHRLEGALLSAFQDGDVDIDFLLKHFGWRCAARVIPQQALPFLADRFTALESKPLYDKAAFASQVLTGLGIGDRLVCSVQVSEALIEWLPHVVRAIEWDPPRWKDSYAEKIDLFFSQFAYVGAIPHLLACLKSSVRVADHGQCLAREVLSRDNQGSEEFGHGSWKGSYEGYTRFLYDVVEYRYAAYYPIAEGARKALFRLLISETAEREAIIAGLRSFDGIEKVMVESKEERTVTLESVVTHSEYEAR